LRGRQGAGILADFYPLQILRPPETEDCSEADALVGTAWATITPLKTWGTGDDAFHAVWIHATAHLPGPNQRPNYYEQRLILPSGVRSAGAFYVFQGIPRDEKEFGPTSHGTELAIAEFGSLARSAMIHLRPPSGLNSASDEDWSAGWLAEVYRRLKPPESRFTNHLGESWVTQRLPFDAFRSSIMAIDLGMPPGDVKQRSRPERTHWRPRYARSSQPLPRHCRRRTQARILSP
jgi:hypothetical protein